MTYMQKHDILSKKTQELIIKHVFNETTLDESELIDNLIMTNLEVQEFHDNVVDIILEFDIQSYSEYTLMIKELTKGPEEQLMEKRNVPEKPKTFFQIVRRPKRSNFFIEMKRRYTSTEKLKPESITPSQTSFYENLLSTFVLIQNVVGRTFKNSNKFKDFTLPFTHRVMLSLLRSGALDNPNKKITYQMIHIHIASFLKNTENYHHLKLGQSLLNKSFFLTERKYIDNNIQSNKSFIQNFLIDIDPIDFYIFNLRLENFKNKEIASILGLTESHTSTRYTKTAKLLQSVMKDKEETALEQLEASIEARKSLLLKILKIKKENAKN